jgi:hypothetical protein
MLGTSLSAKSGISPKLLGAVAQFFATMAARAIARTIGIDSAEGNSL